ncbi:MAG: glycerate kinase [Clostridia bacterium]|nr:glycerate kinase [Clostridia bacterium]
MKKVILIPDSFKGTMSSATVCRIMESAIRVSFPDAQVISVPVADGGEGTVEAFAQACGGEILKCPAVDPYFNGIEAFIGLIDNGQTAVVEMAAAAGIMLRRENHNIEVTTTYGVGQLIEYALDLGVKKIIVGLGGSLTTDGGCGMAAALGVKFFDDTGAPFIPVSGTLCDIRGINKTALDKRLSKVELVAMCDINNPLFGERGAAYVFSPQKGASPEQVVFLDNGLRNLAAVAAHDLSFTDSAFPGAGAAGGLGFGMKAFLNAGMQMGIQTVLDTVNFDTLAADADLVISGEGRLDAQSLGGKVVIGIAQRTKKLGVFLLAIVGSMSEDVSAVYPLGVNAVFSTNRAALPFEKARLRCQSDLYDTVADIMRVKK